jgi:hypothetical protein
VDVEGTILSRTFFQKYKTLQIITYQGCQIFLGTKYQNGKEVYQITTNYTKCP